MAAPAVTLLGGTRKDRLVAGPGVTLTVAVWVMAMPLIVPDTVFVPGTVELSVPLAVPLASVRPAGCASALPPPVAASDTLAPLTALVNASRAVTVMVAALVPEDAVKLVGEAVSVDCDALTGPGVEVATKFTGDPAAVACTVCATVWIPSVQLVVAIPLALVADVAGLTDPAPLVAVHVTVTLGTGLLNWSATRTDSGVGRAVFTGPV